MTRFERGQGGFPGQLSAVAAVCDLRTYSIGIIPELQIKNIPREWPTVPLLNQSGMRRTRKDMIDSAQTFGRMGCERPVAHNSSDGHRPLQFASRLGDAFRDPDNRHNRNRPWR